MNFEISCETYIRLCGVTNHLPDNVNEDERTLLPCVRLERKDGETYALASNRKIAAIYYLGKTAGIDGAVHLIKDAALIKQCETEKAFNSSLFVTVIPELQMASAKTTLGYNYAGNAAFFPTKTPLDKWREWAFREPITATKGAMSWTMADMLALNSASPSGIINFPEFIDAMKPVVLRDHKFPDWVGLFMGRRIDDAGKAYTVDAATLPEWFK